MTQILIKTRELRAHLIITSKDPVRYQLQGVNVQGSNNFTYRLASTDGHRLLVTYPVLEKVDNLDELNIIISHDDIKRIVTGNKNEFVILKIENDRYYLDSLEIRPIDGTYPDIERVVPSFDTLETQGQPVIQSHFNFKYLADAGKVSKLLDHTTVPVMYLNKTQDASAVIGYKNGFMVLMPVSAAKAATEKKRNGLKENLELFAARRTSNKKAA